MNFCMRLSATRPLMMFMIWLGNLHGRHRCDEELGYLAAKKDIHTNTLPIKHMHPNEPQNQLGSTTACRSTQQQECQATHIITGNRSMLKRANDTKATSAVRGKPRSV